VAFVALLGATSACAAPPADASLAATSVASMEASGELTVFAAASLADVFDSLETGWLASHPETRLLTAFDASNVLATQIAEGAPADIFVSADAGRPAELAEAGLAVGEPVPFARSGLTIAVPLEGGPVTTASDLARPGVRLVAAGSGVPITRYADEAIAQLAATAPEAAAFIDAVAANVVSREDNVRAALAKVELGEGDAAIVYETDARSSGLVRAVPFPAGVDVRAEYTAVQVSERPAAAGFLAWLRGPVAAAILAEAGFEPVTE
jgi:molybdate transport system substrate-binding protein